MTLTELSIKRPILIIVFFAVLGILGVFGYTQLRYELLPNIDAPFITVSTIYPGASPVEVENGVTKEIEDAVASIDMVKRVSSNSSESFSLIMMEFRQGADADEAAQNVQRKINEMVGTLPVGVRTPSVVKFNVSDFPVLQVGITAEMDSKNLSDVLRNAVKQRLSRIPGVGTIEFVGDQEREIQVALDAGSLRARGIVAGQVVAALSREFISVPAGSLKNDGSNISINVSGKSSVIEKLGEIAVVRYPDGSVVKLSEVAVIHDGTKDMASKSMVNGRSAVIVKIFKQSNANTVEVSELCRAELQKIERDYAANAMKCEVAQDGSEFTLAAARDVNVDLGLAIVLVALVMFVFLHSLRNSLIVMVAIPASLLSTMVVMYAFDFTLNMMTLLAMSLVIGILVDDSIVVLENIYHHLEKGKDKARAALEGRNEIGFAALAVTLVDVVVFVPLALTPGLIGSIVRQFSLVIVISTLFSLLVSFTLTPMLASRFAKLESIRPDTLMGKFSTIFESMYRRISAAYIKILERALAHRGWVFGVSIVLFVGSLMLPMAGFIGGEFAPSTDKGEVMATMELAPGTNIEETVAYAERFEEELRRMPEVRRVITSVGVVSDGTGQMPSNTAEFSVSFVPKKERTASINALAADIKRRGEAMPGVSMRTAPIGIFGAGNDAPIQIIVSGADRATVRGAAVEFAEMMRGIPGTADVRMSAESMKPELAVDFDRDLAASMGVSTEDAGTAIRIAFAGYDDIKFPDGNRQVPIRVRFGESDRVSVSQLSGMTVASSALDAPVELGQVARVRQTFGYPVLERKDRSNSVTIFSKAEGRTSGDIGIDIKRRAAAMNIPAGVSVTYAGDLELQDDSFGKLGIAFVAAIILVYFVMVALYNSWLYPFVVLFSVPVAMVGAFGALALAGKSLNIFSIFGLIMMIGLVAKNGILLVDRTNENRAQGHGLADSLLEAGEARLRPILMTTFAMILGMLPIAMASGPGGELKSGLGWVLVGGLTTSMFLTLLLVPSVYYSLASLKDRVGKRFKGSSVGAAVILVLMWGYGSVEARPQNDVEGTVLSLDQALRIAGERNPDIRNALLEAERARLRTREAKGNYLPSVDLSVQYTRNLRSPVFFFPSFGFDEQGNFRIDDSNFQPVAAALDNNFSATATVGMPLFNPILANNVAALESAEAITGFDVDMQMLSKAHEVRKGYFSLLILQEQYRLIEQNIARAELTLDESRGLLRRGLATDADTLRAAVSLASLRPSLQGLRVKMLAQSASLALVMGLPKGERIVCSDGIETLARVMIEGVFDSSSRGFRPEAQKAEAAILLADAQSGAERARYLPSVSLFGSFQGQGQSNTFSLREFPLSASVGIKVDWAIFDGLRRENKIQEAEIARQQAALQSEAVEKAVAVEIEIAEQMLVEAKDRIPSRRAVVSSAERSYELVKQRYVQGLVRQYEVRDAELMLSQAKVDYLEAVYDALVAYADFQRARGIR